MDHLCPICGSEAGDLDRTGDAEGYDCPHHGKFKVSDSAVQTVTADRSQWESALEKAKQRATPGIWPTIVSTDF